MAPDVLARVDVVDRSQHLGMQALHVICLGEPIGDDLPVRRYRRRHGVGATELVEADPRDVVRHTFEVIRERHGVEVEVDEHESTPRVDLRGQQREVVVAQRAKTLTRRNFAQLALQLGDVPFISPQRVIDQLDLFAQTIGHVGRLLALNQRRFGEVLTVLRQRQLGLLSPILL